MAVRLFFFILSSFFYSFLFVLYAWLGAWLYAWLGQWLRAWLFFGISGLIIAVIYHVYQRFLGVPFSGYHSVIF